jgi:hypothetical protein
MQRSASAKGTPERTFGVEKVGNVKCIFMLTQQGLAVL